MEAQLGGGRGGGGVVAAQDQDVAARDEVTSDGEVVGVVESDERDAGAGGEVEPAARGADEGRGGQDVELVEVLAELELVDQGAGMLAEIGGKRLADAVGQELFAKENNDEDAADHRRDADEGEFEIAEPACAGIHGGVVEENVDGGAGEHEHRAGMGAEDERHEKLGGWSAETDGHDHDDGQQRRHGAVDADQRREQAHEEHHEHDEAGTAFTRLTHEDLTRPDGDARHLEPGADHEEGRDEDDGGIAKTGKAFFQRENSGRIERERGQHADHDDGQPVPDEKADDARDDGEDDPDVCQGVIPSARGGGRAGEPETARPRP